MIHKLDILLARAIVWPTMVYIRALYRALARYNGGSEDFWAVQFLDSPEITAYIAASTNFGLFGSFFHRGDLWEMAFQAAASHLDRCGPASVKEAAELRKAGRLPS